MVFICFPNPPYANPVAAQSLFNMILSLPVFRYVFFGFLIAGLIFLIIAGYVYSCNSRHLTYWDIRENGVSPEERVQMAHEEDQKADS
jgi:hypothetical protein